jgi:hypothetical protein
MATTNYSWNLPTVGGSEDTWGTSLNANWTALDTLLGGTNATEFAILDGATVSTTELNLLDGVTWTLTDYNTLTASATELNLLDGVTALTGADNVLVTGTAGTDGQFAQWNADGDIVGADIATLPEADWEAGTSTTEAIVSPAKVKAAVDALVGAATAALSVGGVGTYAFLANLTGTANEPGETEAGSNLRYFGIRDTQVNGAGNLYGTAPSGTWMCMGTAVVNAGGSTGGTVWLRIS